MKYEESILVYTEVLNITPSDSTDYSANPLKAISIGGAGAVAVDMPNASAVVIPTGVLIVGHQHRGIFNKIRATGTTATSIVGWR